MYVEPILENKSAEEAGPYREKELSAEKIGVARDRRDREQQDAPRGGRMPHGWEVSGEMYLGRPRRRPRSSGTWTGH